jgi:hypothetical protein
VIDTLADTLAFITHNASESHGSHIFSVRCNTSEFIEGIKIINSVNLTQLLYSWLYTAINSEIQQ